MQFTPLITRVTSYLATPLARLQCMTAPANHLRPLVLVLILKPPLLYLKTDLSSAPVVLVFSALKLDN